MQGFAPGISFEVLAEHIDGKPAGDIERHIARNMGCDDNVGGIPQGIVLGQRLGDRYVKGSSPQLSVLKRLDKGRLVDGPAAADVDQICAVLHE